MSAPQGYTVVVEDGPDFPTPNRVVIHSERLRLRRMARGRKT